MELTPAGIERYLTETFEGIEVVPLNEDRFFFYDPAGDHPADRRLPFATLVNGDDYDQASNLNRPGVFRLNLGVAKETYHSLFGDPPPFPKDGGIVQTGHDFTALDQLVPHPIYASMFWISVLTPSLETWEQLRPMIQEAVEVDKERYDKRHSAEPAW